MTGQKAMKPDRSEEACGSGRRYSHPLGVDSERITDARFATHRDAALALLGKGRRLTLKAGRFLGQIAVDPSALTAAQADWLTKLLHSAGLPPLDDEEESP